MNATEEQILEDVLRYEIQEHRQEWEATDDPAFLAWKKKKTINPDFERDWLKKTAENLRRQGIIVAVPKENKK